MRDSCGSECVGSGPSASPLGTNSQPLPSDCMMNGSAPEMVSLPRASSPGRYEGGFVTKSGSSCPVDFCFASSHQTYCLRSDHGLPSRSVEQGMYMSRRFFGHAHAHSGATQLCPQCGLLRAVWFTPSLNQPE